MLITRKTLSVLLVLVPVLVTWMCTPVEKEGKPNIVFFLVDDLGWKDTGFMGSTYFRTPNIDALAGSGMVFSNAYANAPNCAPTRACLMSGQYSPRHGVYTVATSERGKSALRKLIPVKNTTTLNGDVITIAEMLKKRGYVSASIGKWHLGEGPLAPTGQGFDVNIGGNKKGHPRSYYSPYHIRNLTDGPEGEYLTDRLASEAVRFIKREKDAPFFLYLPFYAVHSPIQGKKELAAKYEDKPCDRARCDPCYAAMIESVDMAVGKVIHTLDSLDLRRNTLIVFFSDNGPWFPVTTAEPLRGSKGMLYEGGIREPLIFSWPGVIAPGSSCDEPVIGLDFYPTFLEAAGVERPGQQVLDGVSLMPLLKGGEIGPRSLFWFFPVYLEPYAGMKKVWRQTPADAIRKGDWKLIEFFEDNHVELYNLAEDLGESNDLSETRKDKAEELLDELKEWRKALNAPVPAERNPEFDSVRYQQAVEQLSEGSK